VLTLSPRDEAAAFVNVTEVTGSELAVRYQRSEMRESFNLFSSRLDLLP
jgi:hypothetical protein